MEATGVSVGKSVLNGTLGCVKSAIAEELAWQLGIQRDHAFIRDELEMMQSFLMAAHDDERDEHKVTKTWVKQVRDLAYDVEDCLQDMAVRVGKPSLWRKCSPRMLLERRRVAQKMKELRAKVEDVSQRSIRYRLIDGSVSKGTTNAMQSDNADELMPGIEEAKQQQEKAKGDLARLISKKDEDRRVIALWGPSDAVERAFFVKRAYDDLKINKKFECCAWVNLMRPFHQKEFLLNIISQFYENLIEAAMEKQEKQIPGTDILLDMVMAKEDDIHLVDVFIGYVKEKNYLVVLNNLSTIEEWNEIKTYFPNSKKGSRVIVTTKQVEVATLCLGAENAKPELTQFSYGRTLYAFYEKVHLFIALLVQGALDGTDSTSQVHISNEVDTTYSAASKEFELIGRVGEKNSITNLVLNEGSQGLQVISVWGMGGLGKTTLVRDVYQSPNLSGRFEKRAWVTVMRPFNCSHLLKSLAAQFGNETSTDLSKLLEEKRYLIVLDDVWFVQEWDATMPHLPKTAASCIIVTTRQKSIAKHCSKNESNIHNLKILEPIDAHKLFTGKVFKEANWENKYPELIELTEPILKKCGGLPLAIVAIGGFLAHQPKSALLWRKLNEHISAELEMNPELETITTVLLKSYDGLPYFLKSCFLYLSIFPEDYKVSRKRLMKRWTAEGYTRAVCGKPAKETTHDMFIELIDRSMILPSQESSKIAEISSNWNGEKHEFCQLHDLLREISITKSVEENLVFRLEEGCSSNSRGTTRHLTISSNWKGDKHEFESTVDLSRVRSLTVFGEWKPFFISEKMRMLRVLDLEDTKDLADHHLEHIGKLIHLKYISLRGCCVFHLPDSLCDLRQLETLDIRSTWIAMLPKYIVKLRNLKYLLAGGDTYYVTQKSLADRSLSLLGHGARLCGACCIPRLLEFQYLDEYGPASTVNFSRCDACNYSCCIQPRVLMKDLDGCFPMLPGGSRKLKGLHTLWHVHLAWGNSVIQDIKRLTQLRKLGVVGIDKKNGPAFWSAISKLSRLESLSVCASGEAGLRGCQDYCSTPSTLPPSKNLQSLKLQGELGKFPEWIGKLQSLVKLRLRFTVLEDANAAIQVLGALPSLVILCLLHDSFNGGEAREVCFNFRQEQEATTMFPSLKVLHLWGISGRFADLKSVQFGRGGTPKLELVLFCDSSLSDVGLFTGLKELPSLREFVFFDSSYTDDFTKDVQEQLDQNLNRPVLISR
uniref:Rx N-terminal domain-containing protein n=1 Tax=Leersia perrieri TaxID=77586 RepID=A0A0D9XS85_9ORYZ